MTKKRLFRPSLPIDEAKTDQILYQIPAGRDTRSFLVHQSNFQCPLVSAFS